VSPDGDYDIDTAVIFDAFRLPVLADMPLVLVGASREEMTAKGFVVPPSAIFAGKIGDAGLRALYENALSLLFPSKTEGFGLPPLEAMICGCPAVVSPAGAIPEICRDAAIYADVADPAGWADAILRLKRDDRLRAEKITAGRARVKDFTWRAAGRRLFDKIVVMAEVS